MQFSAAILGTKFSKRKVYSSKIFINSSNFSFVNADQ